MTDHLYSVPGNRAVELMHRINEQIPNAAHVDTDDNGEPYVFAVVTRDDADTAAALFARDTDVCGHDSLGRREYKAGGFDAHLHVLLPAGEVGRVLARTMLDLDAVHGPILDVLTGRAALPAGLEDATPWDLLDDEAFAGSPLGLVLAWFEHTRCRLPFDGPVPLDPAGDILATLLADMAVARGAGDVGYALDMVGAIADEMLEQAFDGRDVLATARGLAADSPTVRIPASSRSQKQSIPGRVS